MCPVGRRAGSSTEATRVADSTASRRPVRLILLQTTRLWAVSGLAELSARSAQIGGYGL
ncbi:MAG: hypothetical protein ACLQGU_21625 [bacterium]